MRFLGILAMFLEDSFTWYFFIIAIGGIMTINQFFFRKGSTEGN